MNKISKVTIVFIIAFLNFSCNTAEPPDNRSLTLSLEDVSCTEAWLKLQLENTTLPAEVSLYANDNLKANYTISTNDTTLYIDSLLPNKTYNINSTIHPNNQSEIKSNNLGITTMDTTSHNFTWQSWTFGDYSSTLYDCAIISENNIWCVGEIYLNDSLGGADPNAYNAIHWNGSKWELKRIYYYGNCSAVTYPPLKAIWAFSENNIIITNGGSIGWFNGDSVKLDCGINPLLTGAINKLWGTSSNDLYAVGNNGNVVYYNGSQWQKLTSETKLNIYDILGEQTENGKYEILSVASNEDIFVDSSKVLKIEGISVKKTNDKGLPIFINSTWFIPGKKYYIVGDGLYTAEFLGKKWTRDYSLPPYYKTSIRGNGINDIMVVGAFGLLLHFNGFSWKNFQSEVNISGSYGRVNMKNNLVVCTGGLNNGKAIVTIGRR